MAATFYQDWFDDESTLLSTLTMIRPDLPAASRERTKHHHETPLYFHESFVEQPLDELIYLGDVRWNLYMGVGLLGAAPSGKNKKGGKKDVARVPGVWIDLDVGKDGVFRDEEHCLTLLRNVKPWPTIVVATGTGGVHAYWKVRGGLTGRDAELLVSMWWSHMSREAGSGIHIDKLVNSDRIMKLPGSIRWEKSAGDVPSLVRLIHSSSDVVRASELEGASRSAWEDYTRGLEQRRRDVETRRAMALTPWVDLSGAGRWGQLMSAVGPEDDFNESHTWHDVLVPLGWTDIGTDGGGRTLWARPGQDAATTYKSAATGFEDSHVMSLFSDSPNTGLWPLHEAGIALTKYRVWVQTRYDGDDMAYVQDLRG